MYMISQLRMNDGFCSTIWKTLWGCPVQAWSYTSLRTVSCPQFLRLLVLEMTAVICLNKELNGVTSRREKATLSWLVWRLLGDGTEWVSPGHSVEPKTPRTSVPSTVWFPGSVVNGWNVGKARGSTVVWPTSRIQPAPLLHWDGCSTKLDMFYLYLSPSSLVKQ